MGEQRLNIAAAVSHAKYPDIRSLDAVDDNIPIDGVASPPGSQVGIACATHLWMIGKQKKSVGNGGDLAASYFDIASFLNDLTPDLV